MITRTQADTNSVGPSRPDGLSIETTRLSLTALRQHDLVDLMAVFADRNSARMTHAIPHPLTRNEAEDLLSKMMATPFTHWAIRTDEDQLIGIVSLTSSSCAGVDAPHSFGPNLSVFIAPNHQNQGYGLEAVDGLLRWVKKRKLHRIVHAAHFSDNEASANMLITADFLYTGRKSLETSLVREGAHMALHMIRIL